MPESFPDWVALQRSAKTGKWIAAPIKYGYTVSDGTLSVWS